MISFGPRSTLGFFLTPQSQANDWGRDVFGLAVAVQNIVWGVAQPLCGMLADRFGIMRVLWGGAISYAAGLALMAYATTPLMLDLSAGVLIGFGLAGCLVRHRALGIRQASARALALARLRWRRRRRLVRPVPLCAGHGVADRCHRMAADAGDVRGRHAGGAAAWSRARERNREGCGIGAAIVGCRAVGGFRTPFLCAARARLLHLRLPAGIHHRASAGLPGGPRVVIRSRRLDDRGDRAIQRHWLADVGLAEQLHAQTLYPLDHLFRSGAGAYWHSSRFR